MSLFPISESDDFVVHYDPMRGMYRVTVFNDGHFWDEYWFDAYEEKEVTNKTELIGYLNMVKEGVARTLGNHKVIKKEQFEYLMSCLIDNIKKILA